MPSSAGKASSWSPASTAVLSFPWYPTLCQEGPRGPHLLEVKLFVRILQMMVLRPRGSAVCYQSWALSPGLSEPEVSSGRLLHQARG